MHASKPTNRTATSQSTGSESLAGRSALVGRGYLLWLLDCIDDLHIGDFPLTRLELMQELVRRKVVKPPGLCPDSWRWRKPGGD